MNYNEEIVINYFLQHPTAFILEISTATGVSKSSVQRYLKKHEFISIPGTNHTIKEQLEINKKKGLSKGGMTSSINNDVVRDELGHIIGTKRAENPQEKENQKEKDIVFICEYYLNHPTLTIDELASVFEETDIYTKSYVYRCLTSSSTEKIIGPEKAQQIKELLNKKRYSFLKKTATLNLEQLINIVPLDSIEKEIISLRMLGDVSAEEVAKRLNISRAMVLIYEDSAIEKLNEYSEKGKTNA